MNKAINTFLLAGDKFRPKLHLRQPGFTYSSCGLITTCEKIQKFGETGNLKHLYRKELDKACFIYDAAYSDSKDLAKRTVSGKILKYRAYEIIRNPKYNGYKKAIATISVLKRKQDLEQVVMKS